MNTGISTFGLIVIGMASMVAGIQVMSEAAQLNTMSVTPIEESNSEDAYQVQLVDGRVITCTQTIETIDGEGYPHEVCK